MTMGFADYGSSTGMSFSLGSIVGTRSRLTLGGAMDTQFDRRILRLGYSVAW